MQSSRLKALLASLLVTVALSLPITLFGVTDPTVILSMEGMEIKMHGDGSVQLIMGLYVKGERYCAGASVRLDYNPLYLAASNIDDNTALASGGLVENWDFFRWDDGLYGGDNPFQTDETASKSVAQVDVTGHQMLLSLTVAQAGMTTKGKITEFSYGEGGEIGYVFNCYTEKVALGYVSFRIEPEDVRDVLPMIVKTFGGITEQSDPVVGSDYLVQFSGGGDPVAVDAWSIHYYERDEDGLGSPTLPYTPTAPQNPKNPDILAAAWFNFLFDKDVVIGADILQPDVTVNAYQAYRDGTPADLAATLQSYSPMVALTYADGRRATAILPWGRETDGYAAYVAEPTGKADAPYTPGTLIDADNYNPEGIVGAPGAVDYIITQRHEDYPVSLYTNLTVQEISLIGITADDLHKAYIVDGDLPSKVRAGDDLRLPEQARLQTDIIPGNVSLGLDIEGWMANNTHTDLEPNRWPLLDELNKIYPDGAADGSVYWPTFTTLDLSNDSAKHVGTYSFAMAEVDDAGDRTQKAVIRKAEVKGAYPWLIVPNDSYPLAATRTLVARGTIRSPEDYELVFHPWENNSAFPMALQTQGDDGVSPPELRIEIRRVGEFDNMEAGTQFRVRLPDGVELTADWFADNNGDYQVVRDNSSTTPTRTAYWLAMKPGDTAQGSYQAERERLVRQINLGGWFYIAIWEPTFNEWTDYIPVYVPPRKNVFTEDKVYNFIDVNAGLFDYPGTVNKTITLPFGQYNPVLYNDQTGAILPLYVDDNGYDTLDPAASDGGPHARKVEEFGVSTTYDGTTGAQGGRIQTFTVEGTANWSPPVVESQNNSVKTHGKTPEPFAHPDAPGIIYGAYGEVSNNNQILGTKAATLRVPNAADTTPAQAEAIKLTYDGPGSVTRDASGNVTLATYDATTEGYTMRQEFVLTITNTGTTDIHGLSLDTQTGGGNFIVTKAPAAFLPAGESTTFTLTHVYDLKSIFTYRDTIYITSTSTSASLGRLRQFDATFRVNSGAVNRVNVIVSPDDNSMGTAGIIVGEESNAGASPFTMNYQPGSSYYVAEERVYFLIQLADPEYQVKSIEVTDSVGNVIPYTRYISGDGSAAGKAPLADDGSMVYYFDMPVYQTTVTVTFEESLMAKLRLSRLAVFAEVEEIIPPDPGDPDDPDNPPEPQTQMVRQEQRIWQKTYTQVEENTAAALSDLIKGEYLMTRGGVGVEGFEQRVEHYLVVVPNEAEEADVLAILREALGDPITPDVTMTLYASDTTSTSIIYGPQAGSTAPPPTEHGSEVFATPLPGTSNYVRVDINDGAPVDTRRYFIEIYRSPKPDEVDVTFQYGNSPFGMIMSDLNITAVDKDAAKDAFVGNRYSFKGLNAAYIPLAVTQGMAQGDLTQDIHYWSEAWVTKGKLYDPDTLLGTEEPEVYDPQNNMDLNDIAMFITVGTGFKDPGILHVENLAGRPVPESEITCQITVDLLDMGASALPDRYDDGGMTQATIVLGECGTTFGDDWAGDYHIRPGVYTIDYKYIDYDADPSHVLTVSRPVVILAPVGDVDGSNVTDTNDENAVKGRVANPLGDSAPNYRDANLYRYRVSDVNNDRNINNIDANGIRVGPQLRMYLWENY